MATAAGCGGGETACTTCGTVVVAAVGEPSSVFPPLVYETVGRDIGDLVFDRLADLEPGGAPIDSSAYHPRLAEHWERVDSLTWRFRLRPAARWHDGRPVTAEDVVFSFEAFADSTIDAAARPYVEGRMTASAVDSSTVLVRFREPSPEQLFDATYHVRIIPKHIWGTVPRSRWQADTAVARLVGSGPYRVAEWRRGQSLRLMADTTAERLPEIGRVVWRFASDPDAALNLVLSHEADLMEAVGTPDRAARVAADSTFRLEPYPAAVYGFLGFRVADSAGHPHPLFGDAEVRRALASATDRSTLARALFGPETVAPAGPMSRLLWINDDSIRVLPFDTAAAGRMLDAAGWRRGAGGVRRRGGRALAFDILVPSTSAPRRQLAVALQEAWRGLGAEVTVTAVDFPVFQERLGQGRFDTYIGAYLDEPSPRGLGDQWGRRGWGVLNHGHYASARFDALLDSAGREADVDRARTLYREAMNTINADAPAIFLYTPVNVAAIQHRLENVTIDPFSWLSTLPTWSIDRGRALPRDGYGE